MADNNRRIEYMAVSELMTRLHPQNPKEHDIPMIAQSFMDHGFVSSGTLDERTGLFLCGHGRTEALQYMIDQQMDVPRDINVSDGEWYCPVECGYSSLNDAQALAYIAIDNQATIAGDWNKEKLVAMLTEIKNSDDIELPASGFNEEQLKWIMTELANQNKQTEEGKVPVDRAAELNKKWQVQRGDVWEIPSASGKSSHRIMCGDSTSAADVGLLMDGVKMQGVFTSPPYAMQRKDQYGGISADEYVEWWGGVQSCVRNNIKDDGSFFVNIKPHAKDKQRTLYVFDLVIAMVREWGWLFVDEYCWMRTGIPQQVVNRFKNQFEPVYWFGSSGSFKFNPESVTHYSDNVPVALGVGAGDTNAARRQGRGGGAIQGNKIQPGMAYPGNVLDFRQNADALGHPAAFPVNLPEFFIKAYSDENDEWYDPFLGSGTTLVACEQTGRVGYGMEIAPDYVAVCLERLAGMGLEPVRCE